MVRDWDDRADELAAEAISDGTPTAWFDRLYAEGSAGSVSMPWDRAEPQPLLRQWADSTGVSGDGRSAVVVGCGLGADAEFLAALGFATVAFDVSPTAVDIARDRHPGTAVHYRVADLLELPQEWVGSFDLVVEIFTVQALPDPPRSDAVRGVRSLVAPGGTLFAVAFRTDGPADSPTGPPFALSRARMMSFAGDTLDVVELTPVDGPRWRAVLRAGD
jgi:SAM-dependent methyltransferase